jgi:hypothetical protein
VTITLIKFPRQRVRGRDNAARHIR